jgi:hypothetical protein
MPSWWTRWDWKNWGGLHTLSWALFIAAGLDEILLAYLQAGNPLPWHVTAAMLVSAGKVIDLVTHSMTGSTGATDMLGTVAPGAPPEVKAAVRSILPPAAGAALMVLALGALGLTQAGCPQALSAIVPGFDLALCVLNVDNNEPAGTPAEKVAIDALSACGGDAANILKLVTAERRAGAKHAPAPVGCPK